MEEKKKDIDLVNITIGIIMIMLNLWWIYIISERLCDQKFDEALYLFSIPNWVLILEIIGGFIGILLAAKLIRKRISVWSAVPINFGIFCCCILIQILITQ